MNYNYAGKKVLVTGGASFIGSHLTDKLVEQGAKVTVVDDLSSGLIENLSDSKDEINFIEGDLRNQKIVDLVTKDKDIVFHLANIHGGRGFIETHPAEISQNFIIDGNVFYYSHKNGVNKVCFTSSACAYPTNLQSSDKTSQARYLSEEMADPFKEGCALADGEYGWAKFMGEMALLAYHKQYGLKGVACRLFTVYGPRENESHAIMAFIAKALIGQDPFEIWGTGQQDRNFTYVDDVVVGMLLAAEKIEDCRPINIGTDEITKIIDAVKTVCEIVNHQPSEFFCDINKPEGVYARAASIENQKKYLNFHPKTTFFDGIKKTIDWYKNNVDIDEVRRELNLRLFERK